MTKAHRGSPAASLRVHMLYAAPILFSGLGSLVFCESEVKTTTSTLFRINRDCIKKTLEV